MPDLLIEIGTEEIPAGYIEPALADMGRRLSEFFDQGRDFLVAVSFKRFFIGQHDSTLSMNGRVRKPIGPLEEKALRPPSEKGEQGKAKHRSFASAQDDKLGVVCHSEDRRDEESVF